MHLVGFAIEMLIVCDVLCVCCTGIRATVFLGSLDNTVKQISMNVLAIRVPMVVFVWTLWMDSSVSVHVVTMMRAASVMWMSVPVVPARMEERARMGWTSLSAVVFQAMVVSLHVWRAVQSQCYCPGEWHNEALFCFQANSVNRTLMSVGPTPVSMAACARTIWMHTLVSAFLAIQEQTVRQMWMIVP